MRTVVPEKPLDHAISLYGAAAAALLLAALTALPSQPATAQAAVPCTAIDNDEERLACYDRALRGTAQPSATPPPAAQAPPRSASPAAPPAAEPRRERPVRDSAAPAAPTAPAARTAPAAPPAGANSDDEQVIPIVVVGVRALPGRETTFTMQDGTSWVQTDSQRLTSLPDPPFDAELKPGVMGSYFLVAKDRARAIRVRPLR